MQAYCAAYLHTPYQPHQSPVNIIDLIAIVPYYIALIIGTDVPSASVVRLLRVARIVRVMKVGSHSEAVRDLVECVANSRNEMLILFSVMFLAVVILGSSMFYAEQIAEKTFYDSIPSEFFFLFDRGFIRGCCVVYVCVCVLRVVLCCVFVCLCAVC